MKTRAKIRGEAVVALSALLLSVAALSGCGPSAPSVPTVVATPTPAATCPAPAGSGPRQSMTFTTTIDPATPPQHAVLVQIPFPVNGQGTIEAITTTDRGFSICTCLGLPQICRPSCSAAGFHSTSVTVCALPAYVPGQWQFSIHCSGSSAGCQTPLTRPLQATTTVTYTPTGRS